MKWGLVPHWSKNVPEYADSLRAINARDDSLSENKPLWNKPKHQSRCVVLVEGYFEWLKKGKDRVPYYLTKDDKTGGSLLYLAGLYDHCCIGGNEIYSCSIVTTNATTSLSFLHERMPVILNNDEDIMKWLDPIEKYTKELASLLKPSDLNLKWYQVSNIVNKIGNESEKCITPLSTSKETINNFFKKKFLLPKNIELEGMVSEMVETAVKMDHMDNDEVEIHSPKSIEILDSDNEFVTGQNKEENINEIIMIDSDNSLELDRMLGNTPKRRKISDTTDMHGNKSNKPHIQITATTPTTTKTHSSRKNKNFQSFKTENKTINSLPSNMKITNFFQKL